MGDRLPGLAFPGRVRDWVIAFLRLRSFWRSFCDGALSATRSLLSSMDRQEDMKAIGFWSAALVWMMACGTVASDSPYEPRRENPSVSTAEKLVLAGEPGYRFRGGEIITPSAGEWMSGRNGESRDGLANYTFRPMRERKPATPEVVRRPGPAYRSEYTGYLQPSVPAPPYYPVDPYLPYATATPESGFWPLPDSNAPWGLPAPLGQ